MRSEPECLRCLTRIVALLAAVFALPVANPAASQLPADGARTAQLVRIETAPEIDGRLDEAFWSELLPIGELVQSEPEEGTAPSEATEIRVAFDDDNLYLGIRMFDSEPDALIAKQMVLDSDLTSDDRINLVFDTFHDKRNAYFFQINPIGTRSDGLIENNAAFRRDWNGIWHAKASVDAQGWVAEFAIPFKTVSLATDSKRWGFEAERFIRRKNEKARWANPSRNRTILDVAGIGALEGLRDIDATGIDLKPNMALGHDWSRTRDPLGESETESDKIIEPAGDVFYKFHPSIVATFTGNTNFLESPPDDLRTELTRFPPFFPEKRDFFLQDAGIFEFGGLTGNGVPFFSRRIGRLGREPLDIDAGLKLTGRLGRLAFGALGVTLPAQKELDRTTLGVARAQLGVLEESAVGFIATVGDPLDQTSNGLVGADFQYFNSDFVDGDILRGNAFATKTFSSEGGNDDYAVGARIAYPNDKYNGHLAYTQIGRDFDPRLGFANRRGTHRYDASGRRRWRPGGYLRTIDTIIAGDVFVDRGHDLETAIVRITPIELQNQAGDKLRLQYSWNEERLLRAPFEIHPGVVIPLGSYAFNRYGVRAETANYRPVSVIGEVIWGSFYSGDLLQLIGSLSLRPVRYLDGDLDEGNFVKRLARVRFNVAFTPRISWTNVVQYENTRDIMELSSIFRWEIDPGNDFYVVVRQEWKAAGGDVRPTRGVQAAKLIWTFRF
jgi:hypothetical protein